MTNQDLLSAVGDIRQGCEYLTQLSGAINSVAKLKQAGLVDDQNVGNEVQKFANITTDAQKIVTETLINDSVKEKAASSCKVGEGSSSEVYDRDAEYRKKLWAI